MEEHDLDDYGKGRLSVIKELQEFLNKQIREAKKAKGRDSYKNAHLSGVLNAHARTKHQLKKKLNNLEKK